MRFPVEIVRRTREVVGDGFPIIYRMSLLDLVEDGQTWDEIVELALLVEQAGATVINTGIGWHEARVPTIITQVPRGAWTWTTARLREEVSVPVCASNRINTPEVAEQLLADGDADLVSMARPLLADPEFVAKAAAGRADEINTCIACNQACLDHAFANKRATCLVNPRACRETELVLLPLRARRRASRVAGRRWSAPAGLAARGHVVRRARLRGHALREATSELGGQFRLAMADPRQGGVRRDDALLPPPARGPRRHGAAGHRGRASTPSTGSTRSSWPPASSRGSRRSPASSARGLSYADGARRRGRPGSAGGGRSAPAASASTSAVWLTHDRTEDLEEWLAHWGVGDPALHVGGLTERKPRTPAREVYLVQRKTSMIGKDLGKTSGWAHRAVLKQSGVEQVSGATYDLIDDAGLHLTVDGERRLLEVDDVVICAGQESVRSLYDELVARDPQRKVHLIGGADVAAELDAKRAIEQGMRVAADA